jgi:hypothetical protein
MDGSVTFADGIGYKWEAGATTISDLPGLVPNGLATPYHYGAVGNGVADDAAELSAMNTAGDVSFLTDGTYKTPTAPSISVPLIGLGGLISPTSGTFFPKHLYDFGTNNYYYNQRTAYAAEYTDTPTTDYTPIPESSAHRIYWVNETGYQEKNAGNYSGSYVSPGVRLARTGVEAVHIRGAHNGFGDGYDMSLTMAVTAHEGHADITAWAGQNSGGLLGGQVNAINRTVSPAIGAGVGKVNLYGIGDIALNDQGLTGVSMIGHSIILTCDGADTTYETPRMGVYVASNGANDIDAAHVVEGGFKIGMDFTGCTFSTNAAIALKSGQRIYVDGTADTAEGNFIADTVGSVYFGYDSSCFQFRSAANDAASFRLYGTSSTASCALGQFNTTSYLTGHTSGSEATNIQLRTAIANGSEQSTVTLTGTTQLMTLAGSFSRGAPVTKTGDFTVADTENHLINNKAGSACVVTLPSAATYSGREIYIKNIQTQTVDSASSNVIPLAGGAAGTAILAATAGKWALLASNGTNWEIMAGN